MGAHLLSCLVDALCTLFTLKETSMNNLYLGVLSVEDVQTRENIDTFILTTFKNTNSDSTERLLRESGAKDWSPHVLPTDQPPTS